MFHHLKTFMICLGIVFAGVLPACAVNDTAYLGMSAEMGFNTDPAFVSRSIYELRKLGLGSTRMGMDNVGGRSVGAAFDFTARDVVVDKLLAAGIEIRAVISARSMASQGANFIEWTNNWNYFVRGVVNRYKGRVNYYMIGNEPDLTTNTPQHSVDFTKVAFYAARSIDPQIKIESPPVSAPNGVGGNYLNQMLQLGLADYSDYIGLHVYGSQILDQNFLQPWQHMETLGIRKPIRISESGTNPQWAPIGMDGQEWRRRWLSQFYVAMKRAGIDHTLLFSLTFGDLNWAYLNQPNNWTPIEPGYSEIRNWFRDEPFANGGFELPNDNEHEWHVYFNPDQALPPNYITFVTNDVAGAHSGSGYVAMNTGATLSRIILRRVAGQLTSGSSVRLGAWVFVNGASTAQLKALGFDPLDGDREIVVNSTLQNSWEFLSLDVPALSNKWVVVELSATGTGAPGNFVKWDNAELLITSLAPPAPPTMVTAAGREGYAEVWWQPSSGATSYLVSKSVTTNAGSFSPVATLTNLSFLDTAVTNGGAYYYKVIAQNTAGASADSAIALARPWFVVTPVTLIATGSMWRYLDNGSDQGVAWRSTNFNDSAWTNGPAQLGYGDNDEATTVRSNRADGTRIITTYFRHRFFVGDVSALTNLVLGLMRDDGAVVYLNSNEVFRSNIPGTSDYQTRALVAMDGANESAFFTTNLPPSVLRPGTNVVAVEIHQSSTTSSDISFDLFLRAGTIARPVLEISRTNNLTVLRWPRLAQPYRVAAAENLALPNWQFIATPPSGTNNSHYSLVVTNEAPSKIYRLIYEEMPF